MHVGLIREEKQPHDKRVALTPYQCRFLMDQFKDLKVSVQPSPWRSYRDAEYEAMNVSLSEDMSECDWLIGIKEVPTTFLLANKTYMIFSHTIKKQSHNRVLLKTAASRNITLIDYECLVDEKGNRVIGFGRYAGIVGAYNGLMGYGLKYGIFNLKAAQLCHDKDELFQELKRIGLPNIKIVITGGGRVANGAIETMGALNIRKVTPYEFLNYSFREPVYVQLHSSDYHSRKDGNDFSSHDFYKHPEDFISNFHGEQSYSSCCDLLIHCTFWNPGAPVLFTAENMREPAFHISVIADVTCDIQGSIPSTTRASTIEDKFYGYDVHSEKETQPFAPGVVTVMAIDNLPCELPRDASEGFGKHLIERVMDSVIEGDQGLIERATILKNGKLTERFEYLRDYLDKED